MKYLDMSLSHVSRRAVKQMPASSEVVKKKVRGVRTSERADKSSQNILGRLPSEVLIKILSYLDASDLYTISYVNKRLYQLSSDNSLWNKLYMVEFGKNKKQKQKCMDELLLNMATMGLQDLTVGHWKRLYFKTVVACDMNKWKRHLALISRHTGLRSQTEHVLRNLHITWELTVTDKSGHEATLELNRSRFCETCVCLYWSGGDFLCNYHKISTLQLFGVQRIALGCPGLQPGFRSFMAMFDMQALTKSAKIVGQDRMVELKLLQPGIIIGTWRNQCSVAFIVFTLHFHRLLERSVQGSTANPYVEPVVKPLFDDIDPEFGLHGYQLHIVLHNTESELISGSFSQLFCRRTQIHNELIQLTAINRANVSQHIRLSGNIMLPWRCEVLQGAVENCCVMSLTLLDEFRNPFWCVSSLVSMEQEETPVCFEYDGKHFLIHYQDSEGEVKIKLVWLQEEQQYVVVSLVVYVSVSNVNKHFSRDY